MVSLEGLGKYAGILNGTPVDGMKCECLATQTSMNATAKSSWAVNYIWTEPQAT